MRRKISKIFLSAATILLVAAPLLAHHGAATFDTEREVRLKATVTEWIWSNPHCFLKFDAKDETGDVRNWAVETSNPADMTIRGWHRTSFKAGDQVTVSVYPVKNGAPVGRVLRVVLANGDTLVASGPAPQRLAQPVQPAQPAQPARPAEK